MTASVTTSSEREPWNRKAPQPVSAQRWQATNVGTSLLFASEAGPAGVPALPERDLDSILQVGNADGLGRETTVLYGSVHPTEPGLRSAGPLGWFC